MLLFYTPEQGLSLSFSRPAGDDGEALIRGSLAEQELQPPAAPQPPAPETVISKPAEGTSGVSAGRQLDVTRTIAEVFERARRGNTSYLTRFGVKNALVVLDQNGAQTSWQVPDFSIDLEHQNQRSVLLGQANIASKKGDWQLEVRTEQRSRRQTLTITALIDGLVPSGLADNFPDIAMLNALDIPLTGETSFELSKSGELVAAQMKLKMNRGTVTPPWDPDNAVQIDQGDLHLRYHKGRDVVEITASTLTWGKSRATISGEFRAVRADENGPPPPGTSSSRPSDAVLAAEEFGLAPIKVDEWSAEGNIAANASGVNLSRFVIRSGAASIELAGNVTDAPGSPEVHLTGQVSAMPLDTLKQFWPKFLAGDARKWAGESVHGGQVLGGKVNISLAPGELAQARRGGELAPQAVSVLLDLAGMNITYLDKMPPITTGSATLAVSGTTFAVDIPEGRINLPSGQKLALHDGRFYIPDLRQYPQQGQITFQANGATATALQLLDQEPLGYMRTVGLKPEFFGGSAVGDFTLTLPMHEDLQFKEIKLRGAARLDNAIASGVIGDIDVEGGSLDVNVTEQAVDAKGDILIKGVPAKLAWQRLFDAPDDRQPPIKVTALLDDAGREKLGIKVSNLLQGPLPVTLSIVRDAKGTQAMSMQADLTNTQLIFGNMGWTKPKGRPATIQFDIDKAEDGTTDLKNLKIFGDDIAIDGSVSLDHNQHLKSFYFSDFSFDLITHVEITAAVKEGGVLAVEAHGPTYDGKQFFQSLFSAGQLAEDAPPDPDNPFGIDLTARIGTVVGFYDTTVRDVQVTLKKRNGRLVALDAKGQLNGNASMAVQLATGNGARVIKAEARDAGAAFRLVGFYPSVDGGEASLEVNLDARRAGNQERDAVGARLRAARRFGGDRRAVRPRIPKRPSAPISSARCKRGSPSTSCARPSPWAKGSSCSNDAYMNGPVLGATMRGGVNFKAHTVDLGGTYVPLYGLNSALGAIPVLGGIFVGRQGEGVVGITFAIQGKLDDPAVLVNPMSVLTPGIFRQIFEFRGPMPTVSSTSDFDAAAPAR